MSDHDWSAWKAEEPPEGFADRVVAEAMRGGSPESMPPAPRARVTSRRRALAGFVMVATLAASVAAVQHVHSLASRGDAVATTTREVRIGSRAIAVLEPGAHVTWDGDAITQSSGDVFWRVEPGARFTVRTPAADVAVKGTCFRVKVTGSEDAMNQRDAKVGAVGALLGAAAFVGVYEGKVAVSHAAQTVDLGAGQTATADGKGVHLGASSGASGTESAGGVASAEVDPMAAANASLADSVRDYRRRLDALSAEKKTLEKKLAEAEAKVGDAGPPKSLYDLSKDDWKELAARGYIRTRTPCPTSSQDPAAWSGAVQKVGLPPEDGAIVQAAMQRSTARTWSTIKPLCSQALGDINVDRVGQGACVTVLSDLAAQKDQAEFDETVRRVAEIEAGLRPAPGPNDDVPAIERVNLLLASETQAIVDDLSRSLGPDAARRYVFSEAGCWQEGFSDVGPREAQ